MLRGLLAPLYFYPFPGAWDAYVASKLAHPALDYLAVVNPASGVGSAPDPNYAGGIRYLQQYGVRVLGYTATGYGSVPLADIGSSMSTWWDWYRIDGFFLDELDPTDEEARLEYIRNVAAGALTVGNPGIPCAASYFGILDEYVTYEGEFPPPNNSGGMGPGECLIVHSQDAYTALPAGFDYVFETPFGGPTHPNPYDAMSPYLEKLATSKPTRSSLSVQYGFSLPNTL